MTDVRFQQYLARFQNARHNRRAVVQGAAAVAVAGPLGTAFGAHRAGAAPFAVPRRQIDANTLVIADNMRDNWITLDPGWIYEINSQAAMILNYEPLYFL